MERLSNLLIISVAKDLKISKARAIKHINSCMQKVATELNVDYSHVYNTFYTFSGLSLCLAGNCAKTELDKCSKLCHCVIFNDKCVPRYIPQAVKINEDPDKWVKGMSTKELETFIDYAAYLYYNYDGGGLTDSSFDSLEYELNKRLKTRGRSREKIGAMPVPKLRVKLPYMMGSLEKIKPDTKQLVPFLEKGIANGLVVSDKLDGVSGLVVYKNGSITGIFTRGDGEIGGNVTYLKDYINFPKVIGDIVVRGEFILSKKNWDEKYKDTYANARSFVSAKINSGYISLGVEDIEYVAYRVIDPPQPPNKDFEILSEKGFTIPFYKIYPIGSKILTFDIITLYKDRRQASLYTIDGLVLTIDKIDGESKAFKMVLEEQLRNTVVTNVEWGISRYGRYVPVAVYAPVFVDGIRLHRASAHNAKHVEKWNMGKGSRITVVRSGDVIPVIKDVIIDTNIEPIFPESEEDWFWKGNDIVLHDIENNPEVQIKRLMHFFATIKVPQFAEGRIRKLYSEGYKTLQDITAVEPKELIKIKGIGQKTAQMIYENIHKTLRNTRLDRFYVAFTSLESGVGRVLLKQVTREYPGIFADSSEEIKDYFKKNKIKGIGPARIKALVEGIPKFREMVLSLDRDDIQYALEHEQDKFDKIKKEGYNKLIKGGQFVLTGFLGNPNYDLEDYIWDNMGNIAGSVTKNTTAVISATITNITSKMTKAHEMGIPIYTVEEFIDEFNIPQF